MLAYIWMLRYDLICTISLLLYREQLYRIAQSYISRYTQNASVTLSMDNLMIARVAKFSGLYRNHYMKILGSNIELIRTHWWHAFRFLLMKLLDRGRNKIVSRRIREMVEDTFDGIIDIASPDGIVGTEEKALSGARLAFEKIQYDGTSYKSKTDIQMLFGVEMSGKNKGDGVLQFLMTLPSGNIVQYSINEIQNHNISGVYERLCQFPGVGHIGAATYLRDLVDLFYDEVDEYVKSVEAQTYLLPVDACVRRVARESGIIFDSSSSFRQARRLAEACHEVSIIHKLALNFNQGAIWLCDNTFETLMSMLKKKTTN